MNVDKWDSMKVIHDNISKGRVSCRRATAGSVSLREKFRETLNIKNDVDLLMQDNNTAYIAWLECQIEKQNR